MNFNYRDPLSNVTADKKSVADAIDKVKMFCRVNKGHKMADEVASELWDLETKVLEDMKEEVTINPETSK